MTITSRKVAPRATRVTALRKYREAECEKLKDAVYRRRCWDENGVPTLQKVKELGIYFPEVVELQKRRA